MRRVITAIIMAALFSGASLSLQAADQPADKAPDGKKETPEKFKGFNGKVKSVDKVAKSITLEGDKAQTLQITSETRISKDRRPATLDAVTAGDHVTGRAREGADGKWEALTLNDALPPKAKLKSEEKKPESK